MNSWDWFHYTNTNEANYYYNVVLVKNIEYYLSPKFMIYDELINLGIIDED